MADLKRKDVEPENGDDGNEENALVVKKQRTDEMVAVGGGGNKALTTGAVARTSNLLAPIMLLTGHKAEIYSMKFSPTGKHLCSGSFDKTILLYNVYGECENWALLRGHQSAVLEVHWSMDGGNIFSCSADKTIMMWDPVAGTRVKKCTGHSSFVNSCCPTRRGVQLIVSGSDDRTAKLWDVRVRGCVESFDMKYPVTAVSINESTNQIYVGGLDNHIKIFDLRKKQLFNTLSGHEDTITGLELSPSGNYLLSNGMDHTVRMWDVRPFVQGHPNVKTFTGIQHNFEKILLRCAWSPDESKVSAGSADRFVYVWDVQSKRILYKLPGHRGSVNEVDFHPTEPIIGSASSDHTIYLGEIKP